MARVVWIRVNAISVVDLLSFTTMNVFRRTRGMSFFCWTEIDRNCPTANIDETSDKTDFDRFVWMSKRYGSHNFVRLLNHKASPESLCVWTIVHNIHRSFIPYQIWGQVDKNRGADFPHQKSNQIFEPGSSSKTKIPTEDIGTYPEHNFVEAGCGNTSN